MLSIYSIFSLFYVSIGLSNKPLYVTPFRDPLGAFSNSDLMVSTAYNITKIMSFILIWIATVLLLHHHSIRVGKAKYWLIVSIPLLYFLGQFQGLFIDAFSGFRLQYTFIYNIAFTLIFNSTYPVGGILFGLAFWNIAKNTKNVSIRTYLTISAIGVILLFGAQQASTLIRSPYPPFGSPSLSFDGLSSYLILIGIYYSALSVARDSELRKSIIKSVQQQSTLLHSIGTAEMEEEVIRRAMELQRSMTHTDHDEILGEISTSLDDVEVKQYIRKAMQEVRKM
jgi:hypothetical protein